MIGREPPGYEMAELRETEELGNAKKVAEKLEEEIRLYLCKVTRVLYRIQTKMVRHP